MNKQELIEKLEEHRKHNRANADKSEELDKSRYYFDGVTDAYGFSVHLAKQLDKPQKHVMPKFFDDWAKRVIAKHNEFYAISLVTRAGWGYGVDYDLSEDESPLATKELLGWIIDYGGGTYPNKKKAVEALLYGYEVEKEKEPVYNVIINGRYLVKMSKFSNVVILVLKGEVSKYATESYELTEKQIKAIDERYWPFAEPVEEVAEE